MICQDRFELVNDMGKSSRLTKEHRENLVAFIDGELEEETYRDLEKTVADNPVARHEIDILKKPWGLLDYLDRPDASDNLIEKTMTELKVVSDPKKEFEMPQWWSKVRQGLAYSISVAGILVAVVGGYLTATRWIPSQADEIARDLPVIKNYDELNEIGSVAFLELLKEQNLVNEIKTQSDHSIQRDFPGGPFRK